MIIMRTVVAYPIDKKGRRAINAAANAALAVFLDTLFHRAFFDIISRIVGDSNPISFAR